MKLFETLAGIMPTNADTTIVVRKTDSGNLVVSTSLKLNDVKDGARDIIPPFVVNGSPSELDSDFAALLKEPVTQSAGLQDSMKNFEAGMKAAQAKSQSVAEQKKKTKAEYDKLMSSAAKLEETNKYSEAATLYEKALAIAEGADKSKAQSALDKCKKKQQPDIFSDMFDEKDADETAPAETESQPEPEAPENNEPETEEKESEPAEEDENEPAPDPLAFGD